MRPSLVTIVLCLACWTPMFAGDAPAPAPAATELDPAKLAELQALQTPEGQVKAWLKMVRRNDFTPLLTMIPAKEWAPVERIWKIQLAKQGPKADAELDRDLALFKSPKAAEVLMARLEPQLSKVNPEQLATQIRGVGMLLAAFSQQPAHDEVAKQADIAGLQSVVGDVADWVQKSGLNDPAKARKLVDTAIVAVKALNVSSAAELRQTPLQTMIPRLGPTLAAVKDMLRVYDVNLDALIDSVVIKSMVGEGNQRTMTVTFTAFNKQRELMIDLVKRGSTWELKGPEGRPFAQFMPLINPLLTMGGFDGGKPRVPEPPQDVHPPGTL